MEDIPRAYEPLYGIPKGCLPFVKAYTLHVEFAIFGARNECIPFASGEGQNWPSCVFGITHGDGVIHKGNLNAHVRIASATGTLLPDCIFEVNFELQLSPPTDFYAV
jgi:hypothetical protein